MTIKKRQSDKGSVTLAEGVSNLVSTTWESLVQESYADIDFEAMEAAYEPGELEERFKALNPISIPNVDQISIARDMEEKYGEPKPIYPKFHPHVLRDMAENDPDVSASLDAYAVNIGGVKTTLECNIPIEEKYDKDGKTIRRRTDTGDPVSDAMWREMLAEKETIQSFVKHFCPNMTFRQLRMRMVHTQEQIGNEFLEAIRNKTNNAFMGARPIKDAGTIRLCEEDLEPVEDFPRLILEGTTIKEVPMDWTFRRYVQFGKRGKRYYKSLNDPRDLDRDTGVYYEKGKLPKGSKPATELIHFKMSAGIDYGIPRFRANAYGIQTNKGAQLTNRETMNNSGIPKLAVILRNIKDQSLAESIKQNFRDIKKAGSKEMIMVIRTPPAEFGVGPEAKQVENEIRFEKLSDVQEKEGLYLKMQEHNTKKTRITMRLPDQMLGIADSNLNRATAFIMASTVEKQVFQPARQDFDDWMNREIFPMMGFKYWSFLSQSQDINDTELYIRLLTLYASYGALLPNDLRTLAPELLDVVLPPLEEAWASIPKHIAILQQKVGAENANAINNPNDGTASNDTSQTDAKTQKRMAEFGRAVLAMMAKEVGTDDFAWLYKPESACG